MATESDPRDPNQQPTAPPTAPTAPPPASYFVNGTPSQALLSALYPGYTIQNGQFVYGGQGQGSISDPTLASDYLNKLWDPLSKNDYYGFWNALGITNDTASPATLKSYAPQLWAAGFHLNPNAAGEFTDFTLPNGQIIDPLKAGGTGGWQWLDATNGHTLGDLMTGPLTAPFGKSFDLSPKFDAPQFHAPTLQDMLVDPGYQFRLQQGEQALEQSAAARGVLNTGGTLKDLISYGQSAASQEFPNVWQRSVDAYNLAYRGALDENSLNYDRAYQKWLEDYNQYTSWQDRTFRKQYDVATA